MAPSADEEKENSEEVVQEKEKLDKLELELTVPQKLGKLELDVDDESMPVFLRLPVRWRTFPFAHVAAADDGGEREEAPREAAGDVPGRSAGRAAHRVATRDQVAGRARAGDRPATA